MTELPPTPPDRRIDPVAVVRGALSLWRSDMFVLTAVPLTANLLFAAIGLMLGTADRVSFADFVFGPLVFGVIVCLAQDAMDGVRRPFSQTWARVAANFLPLIALSLAAALGTLAGMLLLIIPGLYIAAVWMAHVPIILFENGRWGALGQSYALSKPQAWPLVGVVLILVGLTLVLLIALSVLVSILAAIGSPELVITILGLVFSSALTAVYGCAVLIVWHRLSGGSRDLSAVFE